MVSRLRGGHHHEQHRRAVSALTGAQDVRIRLPPKPTCAMTERAAPPSRITNNTSTTTQRAAIQK